MTRLSRRERIVIGAGCLLAACFMVIQWAYLPACDKIGALRQALETQTGNLSKMRGMQRQIRELSRESARQESALKFREKGFTLFSFLETRAKESRLKDRIAYMKPSTQEVPNTSFTLSKVKLKLQGVYLKDLVDFLARVESSKNGVQIAALSLSKSGKKGELLDAVIEAQALFSKEGATL